LNVANFADESTIRKAYIKLAKTHHPDVSKGSDGERFKVISKAYTTLSDENTKYYHDQKLTYYLQPRAAQKSYQASAGSENKREPRRAANHKDYKEKKARAERIKLRMDMLYYQKQNNILRYEFRIFGWMVISFFGWQQVYSHWFVNNESFDHMFAVLGFFLFGFATLGMYSNLYKKMRFNAYSGKTKVKFLKKSTRYWLVYVFVGLLILPILNTYRKSYHLEHYAKNAIVNFSEIDGRGKIEISFKPFGTDRLIIKQLNVTDRTLMDYQHHWVMIRFSKANPRIMELVEKSE
jgi:curved DNA-binding protein CbpA